MAKQKSPVIPGKVLKFGDLPVRVVDGAFRAPENRPLKVLHEVEGLCAWVGRVHEDGRVFDAVPVFTNPAADDLTVGCVLLTDLARDFTVDHRLAGNNFHTVHSATVNDDVFNAFGDLTFQYMGTYLGRGGLGADNAKFVAKRMARVLGINYPDLGKGLKVDGCRLLLTTPFTILAKFESHARFTDLKALATWLGSRWRQAERNLLTKCPVLADRSAYFTVGDEAPGWQQPDDPYDFDVAVHGEPEAA